MARVMDRGRARATLLPVTTLSRPPGGVAAPVPTVIVEEAVAGLGLKLAVAPPGNPLTAKVTAAVKPPEGVMLTAYVVPPPCTIDRESVVEGKRVDLGGRRIIKKKT